MSVYLFVLASVTYDPSAVSWCTNEGMMMPVPVWISQNGGRRHLRFLKFPNFKGWKGHEGQYASPCLILWQSVKPLQRYGDFSFFPNWRLPDILDL